jgi:hypothetical protein
MNVTMKESKYAKYVITKPPSDLKLPDFRKTPTDKKLRTCISYLDGKVIEGAFYVECVWYWPGDYPEGGDFRTGAHVHDFDEVVTFFGTDPKNPQDLCGEVEFWIEDEKFSLTQSSMIYIPKGMKHCPLIIKRVDRPIFHFTTGPGKDYK